MSVDRSSLLHVLGALPFAPGRWVVAGSAPMLMAGLIDAIEDVDIVVDEPGWRQAAALGGTEPREGLFGDRVLVLDVVGTRVEVFDGWLGVAATEMIADGVDLDGFRFAPLSRVLESKRLLSRPRDVAHIAIIEACLEEGQEPTANGRRPNSD